MRIVYLIDRPAEDVVQVAGWFMERLGPENVEQWLPLIGSMLSNRVLPATFVAVENDVVLGTASLVDIDPSAPLHYGPWLTSVHVPDNERGRGICAALLRRVQVEAQALGFPRLYFQTTGRVEPYEELGWHWIGSTIADSTPAKILALELAPFEQAA